MISPGLSSFTRKGDIRLLHLDLEAVTAKGDCRQPRWVSTYVFHTILFLWLGWLSFPWLGEGF